MTLDTMMSATETATKGKNMAGYLMMANKVMSLRRIHLLQSFRESVQSALLRTWSATKGWCPSKRIHNKQAGRRSKRSFHQLNSIIHWSSWSIDKILMFEYCATFILDIQCLIRSWRRMYSRNDLRKFAALHDGKMIQSWSPWYFWIDLFDKSFISAKFLSKLMKFVILSAWTNHSA